MIGAPRIIIDLDGHTIDGIGLGTGIRNEGYETVTVRDGTRARSSTTACSCSPRRRSASSRS